VNSFSLNLHSRGIYRRIKSAFLPLLLVLYAAAAVAGPPPDKGGGKGGKGGGGGSGPIPELHFKWRVPLLGAYSRVRPVVGQDGTIYAVDVADNLYAVDPDGEVLWVMENAGGKGVDLGLDGTIYTGNENWVKAYRPNGSLKWAYVQNPRAFVFIDVAVGPDGNVYGVASSGMGVFSLADTPSGPELRWTNPEPYGRPFTGYSEIAFGPTLGGSGDQLYFHANGLTRAVRLVDGASVFTLGGGNTRPRVSELDGTWHRPGTSLFPDGSLDWVFEFPLATGTTEPSLGPSGTHYAVNSGDTLYSITPGGAENWHAEQAEFLGLPDVDPGEAYVLLPTGGSLTHPAALLSVSTANGNPLWRMEFPSDGSGRDQFVDSGAAFSADGGTAYVMTAVAVAGNSYLNAVDTDPSIPSASTQLRSAAFSFSSRSKRGTVTLTGNVQVLDENRAPVSGAAVDAYWTKPDGSTAAQTATTGGTGQAKFSLSASGGIFKLTVTGIASDGYEFDPQHSLLEGSAAAF